MLKSERWELLRRWLLWVAYGSLNVLYAVYLNVWWFLPGVYALAYLKTEPLTAVMGALMCVTNLLIVMDFAEKDADGLRVFELAGWLEAKQKAARKRVERQKRYMYLDEKSRREGPNIFDEYEISCILSEDKEEK